MASQPSGRDIRGVYERQAGVWDAARNRSLFERAWLDRLLSTTGPGDTILDAGCGAGEPIARYLIGRGRKVCGVDFSEPMLAIARRRFPEQEWIAQDMRELELGREFAAIVAWDSFFHLAPDDQRATLAHFGRHVRPGGGLLITVGPDKSETIGAVGGEPVYHASLSPEEYERELAEAGLHAVAFSPNDAACAGHSVLFAEAKR